MLGLPRRGATLALTLLVMVGALPIAPAAAAPTPTATYSLDPIPGLEYVAIAPLSLADHLAPLIDWKSAKGVPAQTFPLEYILGAFAGRDDAEKVHAFLRDLHYNKAPSTKWLLAVGDGDWQRGPVFPVREVFTNSQQDNDLGNSQNWYSSDTYFGNLESNWDEDADGVFGELNEGDWTPELYVGRVPIDLNATLLDEWVRRQLAYERNPPAGPWARRAILAGSLMDRPNVLDDIYTSVDEGYDPFTDNAWRVDEEVAALVPAWMDVERYYDYPMWDGGAYSPATDTLTAGALKGALDGGASFMLLEGHGYTSNRGVAQYDDPAGTRSIWRSEAEAPALRWDEVLNLTNGDMLPFVYVSACYSGDFTDDDDTSFEAFLKAPYGGAIAVVAGNGENYRLENVSGQQAFGNWWLAHEFFRMLFVEGYTQPGKVLGDLKARYNSYYMAQGPTDEVNRNYFRAERVSYNLMGDPEFSLITDDPATLEARPVRQPLVGERTIDVEVLGRGGAIAGALVRGEGWGAVATATTNATGVARLSLSVQGTQPINLTATAANHRPFTTSAVAAVPERDLAFAPGGLSVSGPLVRNATVTVEGFVEARGITTFAGVVVEFRLANPLDGPVVSAQILPSVAPQTPRRAFASLTFDAPGDYLLYATIDPAGAQTEDTAANNVAFAAVHINAPPRFAPLPPIDIAEGAVLERALALPAYTTDAETSAFSLAYRVVAVSDQRLTVAIDGTSLSFMAQEGAAGVVQVDLEASDGLELATARLEVRVLRTNHAPEILPLAPARATVGVPFSVNLSASDPEGESVVWSDASPLLDITPAGRIAFTPRAQDVGTWAVTVTASDGRLSSQHSFVLTIEEREQAIDVRNPPLVRAAGGQEVVIDLGVITGDHEVTFAADNPAVRIDLATRTLRYTPPQGDARVETLWLSASKPGFATTRVAVAVDVAGQATGGFLATSEGAALAIFGVVGAALAGVVGLQLARAHQARLRDEKIFMIEGKKGSAGAAKGGRDPAARRAREEE